MKLRKNILYISFLGILEPVAFSQVFSYVIELNKEKNFRFTLLTFEKTVFLKRKDFLDYRKIQETLCKNGINWHILKHHRQIGKIYDLFIGFLHTIFLVLEDKIDIIHARSNEPIVLAFFISKIFRVKIIYDRRGIMADDYSDDANTNLRIKKGGIIYRLLESFERQLMYSSDAIVVLTRKIFSYVTQEGYFRKRKNVFIIPCCVDLNRFNKFLKNNSPLISELKVKDKFIFNYTGSLYNIHCFFEMLDFFKIAKEIIPKAHFIFLTLTDREIVEAHIRRKKIDIRDFTIISTTPLRVNDYLCICDASIMFFKPSFNKLAASPVKFAECLASGLPIIINKGIGDTEEIIEKNRVGVVVEDFSESAYFMALQRLLKLLNEPGLRLRCRKIAESNFSLQLGAEQYRKIYESLLT